MIRLWPAAISGTPRRHVGIGVGRGSSGIHRDMQDGAGYDGSVMTTSLDLRFTAVLVVAVAGLAAFAVACASLGGGASAVEAGRVAAVDHSYAATGTAWAYGVTRTARAHEATGTALAFRATVEVRAHEATGTALAYEASDAERAWEAWGTAQAVETTATAVVRDATRLAVARGLTGTAGSVGLTATAYFSDRTATAEAR